DADRALLEQLRKNDYAAWRDVPLAQMEAAGQHEVLNWTCLAGAMHELNYKADILDWVETWTFNASKCMAMFRPA
ncbi:MAG: extradiol ring-cleavage dioxygenase, partial [Betaproteobacteria bacterium]|nr:extradiol ring-cleavage dioxygenase [Betaproteobacteria bacterium]